MDLFISKYQFLKSKKCDWFLDVQKSIFWYQEMDYLVLKFTRGSAVFHNTMKKLRSIIQSLYLYFIKIVPFCPHPPFWDCVLLYLRSPKGGCCSISDDLSCSMKYQILIHNRAVFITATGVAVLYITVTVSRKNGFPNISDVHSSRKHWKYKYMNIYLMVWLVYWIVKAETTIKFH